MTHDISPAPAGDAAALPDNALIAGLFELAAIRDIESLLNKALGLAIRVLRAEAGSILFQGQPPHTVRLGVFRPEAMTRIERWEEIIAKRLADATWNIPVGGTLPVSTSKIPDGPLTLLNIPLLRDTMVVGSLSLALKQEIEAAHHTTLGQIARAVGQMASLVADLDGALHRLKQIGMFYQISQDLVTTFDVRQLLADTMTLSASVIDAGVASVMLIDDKAEELVFEVSHGPHAKALRQQRIPLDEGIGGWVAQHGQPVIANNARTDPRFSNRVDVRTGFLTQSIAAVPLKIKGRIIGVLEVLNKYASSGFDHEDIQLMNAIASQVAIAIENSRLYQNVKRERDEAIESQENLRRHVTDTIHNESGRLLSAIRSSLDHLERLNEIEPEAVHNEINALRNLVFKATRGLRHLSFDTHPALLESRGLAAALDQYLAHLRCVESFTLHFEPTDLPSFLADAPQIAETIFAVIQEAINNVRFHAGARNVWLSFEREAAHWVVTVRDDGNGFDVAEVKKKAAQNNWLGLVLMAEQARSIGADLEIESRQTAPRRGTSVQLRILSPETTIEMSTKTDQE